MRTSTPGSESDPIETWADYWDHQYETNAQPQLEAATRQPRHHWLLVDVGSVVAEPLEVTIKDIGQRPDTVIADIRDGFETFARNEPEVAFATDGYDDLPVHFIGLSPTERNTRLVLDDPVLEANRLRTIPNASISTPEPTYRASQLTYRCPDGHETTLEQPIYRSRTLTRCGTPECSNEVFVDDTQTRVRPIVEFEIDSAGGSLSCVGTGLYAAELDRLAADRLHLVGIPRRKTLADGTVEAVYELTSAHRIR